MAKFTLGSIEGDIAVCQRTEMTRAKSGKLKGQAVFRCVKYGKNQGDPKPHYNRTKLRGRKRKTSTGWTRAKTPARYRYKSGKALRRRMRKSTHSYYRKSAAGGVPMAYSRNVPKHVASKLAGLSGTRRRKVRKTRKVRRTVRRSRKGR